MRTAFDNPVWRAKALWLTMVALSPSCASDPPLSLREEWVADLTQTSQVLFMSLTIREGDVSGSGALGSLTNVGTEPLDVLGRRVADSLSVTFTRASGSPFSFSGRYAGPGIVGILHGGSFDSLSIGFRRR